MTEAYSFLQELEDTVSLGSPESRLRALWHATDLLIAGRYNDDQIWAFGEVIERLAGEIEAAARAQLAQRLARSDNAPINMIKKLAFDDSIAVAGPVLQQSQRLDVRALVANAQSKSQLHLLAISRRSSISEPVTDVLVKRGDRNVATSVAANEGARFSETGFLHLVKRSEGDSILAEQLGLRRDIPRHLFHQLISKASDEVRKRLGNARPELVNQIQTAVTDVTGVLHSKFGPASSSYFVAKRLVGAQHRYGNLGEAELLSYAQAHKSDETIVAFSLLCGLPAEVVERSLFDKNNEMILILAKALDLSWPTAMALLFLGAEDHRLTASRLDKAKGEFDRLNVATCRQVLKVYQSRREPAGTTSHLGRLPQLHGI